MIDPTQTGLRGRDAVISSAPFVWDGPDTRIFHEREEGPKIGDVVLLVSDTADQNAQHVQALVDESEVYSLAVDCLTVLPKHVPELVVPIPPEVCANVVYSFDGRGYPPGSFFRKLTHAIVGADPHNRNRLALAFPEWVRAVNLAQNHVGGLDMMMKANRDNRPLL